MKALVIGAGFGGIAAALRLRAKGYEVALIDRCAAAMPPKPAPITSAFMVSVSRAGAARSARPRLRD